MNVELKRFVVVDDGSIPAPFMWMGSRACVSSPPPLWPCIVDVGVSE